MQGNIYVSIGPGGFRISGKAKAVFEDILITTAYWMAFPDWDGKSPRLS